MAKFRKAKDDIIEEKQKIILDAMTLIYENVLESEPFPRLSKATIEAIFVGVIRNYANLVDRESSELQTMYKKLRADNAFSVESLKEGLAAPDRVKARLDTAVNIFGGN